jgi:cell division initiation protein
MTVPDRKPKERVEDMLSPQNIREKTFEKAVFGGYDMSSVDDFLENVAADFTSLQKDNAILKGKMKVLVEKIENIGPRRTHAHGASAAQKMANQIVAEAKENSEAALNAARLKRRSWSARPEPRYPPRKRSLWKAQRALAKYIDNLRLFSQKHLEF